MTAALGGYGNGKSRSPTARVETCYRRYEYCLAAKGFAAAGAAEKAHWPPPLRLKLQ